VSPTRRPGEILGGDPGQRLLPANHHRELGEVGVGDQSRGKSRLHPSQYTANPTRQSASTSTAVENKSEVDIVRQDELKTDPKYVTTEQCKNGDCIDVDSKNSRVIREKGKVTMRFNRPCDGSVCSCNRDLGLHIETTAAKQRATNLTRIQQRLRTKCKSSSRRRGEAEALLDACEVALPVLTGWY